MTAHNKLIVDAYNANPTSMRAALANFRDMRVSPKMAILGDMKELGDVSAEEHQKLVDAISAARWMRYGWWAASLPRRNAPSVSLMMWRR